MFSCYRRRLLVLMKFEEVKQKNSLRTETSSSYLGGELLSLLSLHPQQESRCRTTANDEFVFGWFFGKQKDKLLCNSIGFDCLYKKFLFVQFRLFFEQFANEEFIARVSLVYHVNLSTCWLATSSWSLFARCCIKIYYSTFSILPKRQI